MKLIRKSAGETMWRRGNGTFVDRKLAFQGQEIRLLKGRK